MSRVYSVKQLSVRWDVHISTVYDIIARRGLKSFKLGGKLIRVRAEDLEQWENAGGNMRSENTDLDNSTAKPSSSGGTKKGTTVEDLVFSLK